MNGWETWNDWYRREWRPVMEWMVRAAGVAPGMTVLDLACGTGQPAFLAAERVAPGGRVVAIDVDADMLASARRLAHADGITNVEFRELDMHELRGIAEASIDAITYGFALMFSPKPAAVLAEMQRVLKPGARFALAVWGNPAETPFLSTVFAAMASVVPPPPSDPDAPGPFRFAQPGALDALLRAAGFSDLTIEPVPMVLACDSPATHWQRLLDMTTPLRRAVESRAPADRERIRDALFRAIEPFASDGNVRLSATPLCASGRK